MEMLARVLAQNGDNVLSTAFLLILPVFIMVVMVIVFIIFMIRKKKTPSVPSQPMHTPQANEPDIGIISANKVLWQESKRSYMTIPDGQTFPDGTKVRILRYNNVAAYVEKV